MPEEFDAITGGADDAETDGYPWSWPRPIPDGSEVGCPLTLDSLRIAEAIAKRRFFHHPDGDDLIQDAVSYAWELSQQPTYQQRGHAGSIAAYAVKRVASGRQFVESETSINHPNPKHHDRPRRRRLFQGMSDGRQTAPPDAVLLRLDLAAWLDTLTARQHEVALLLATGHTTTDIAERSGCTTNAVRMIRSVLRRRYEEFLTKRNEHRAG